MEYIDPAIYNSKNLHKKDLATIQIMDNVIARTLKKISDELKDELEWDPDFLNQMYVKDSIEILKKVWNHYKEERQNTIAEMMNSYNNSEFKATEPDNLGEFDSGLKKQ